MMRKNERLNGSLTVEAALVLSLFFFAVVTLALPIDMLDVSRDVRMTMEARAREFSTAAGVSREGENPSGKAPGGEGTSGGEENFGDEGSSGGEENPAGDTGISGEVSEIAAEAVLYAGIMAACGDRISNLDVGKTRILKGGEIIDLRVSYTVKPPFGLFGLSGIRLSERSLHRGFVGESGKTDSRTEETDNGEEEMVYVGRDSTRYHKNAACHYLSNDMRTVSPGEAGSLKNRSGRRYTACAVCGNSASGEVYILPKGDHYHGRPDCPALAAYVRKVPLRAVEHLGACSYCSGGGS